MKDAIIGVTMDRSGSMQSMWSDAVGGFNTFKNDQADEEGNAYFILTYFDNEVKVKHEGINAKEINDLATNDAEIFPRGATALRDGLLHSISRTDFFLKENPDFDGEIIQVVITDGMENASKVSAEELKGTVEAKEKDGWNFIFLAANIDTAITADTMGFSAGNSVTYDSNTVSAAYSVGSQTISTLRSTQNVDRDNLVDSSKRDVRGS